MLGMALRGAEGVSGVAIRELISALCTLVSGACVRNLGILAQDLSYDSRGSCGALSAQILVSRQNNSTMSSTSLARLSGDWPAACPVFRAKGRRNLR